MGGKACSGGPWGMAQAVKRNVTFPPMSPRACGGPVVGPPGARRGVFCSKWGLSAGKKAFHRGAGVLRRPCRRAPGRTQGDLRFPSLRLLPQGAGAYRHRGAVALPRGAQGVRRGRGASEGGFSGVFGPFGGVEVSLSAEKGAVVSLPAFSGGKRCSGWAGRRVQGARGAWRRRSKGTSPFHR